MAKVLLQEFRNGETKRYQDVDNPQGVLTYVCLFSMYVLRHCTIWDETKNGGFFIWESCDTYIKRSFGSEKEMTDYAIKNNITIRNRENLDHPLAHGLPDTRSIH